MTPFAPLSYIGRNRARSAVLALMLGFTVICFLAGMYIDHPAATFEQLYDKPSDHLLVYPGTNSLEIRDEFIEFVDNVESYCPDNATKLIGVGSINISFKSIMGYENSTGMFMFRSEDDFAEFNRVMTDVPDDIVIHNDEVMLSQTLADNWGVKVGDVLDEDWDKASIYVPVTVKVIADIPGMVFYGVSDSYNGDMLMILRNEPDSVEGYDKESVDKALEDAAQRINNDYPHIRTQTNRIWMNVIREQLSMLTFILAAITAVIGIVLAITVNAAFSAAYEKRRYEFSIYKAIGFTGGRVFGKIAGEVLLLDLIGLIAGTIICSAVILIINYILTPQGLFFFKVSVNGILATIVCNLMVVVPVIISNIRRIRRYDVTVY